MTEAFIFIIEEGLRREGDGGDKGMDIHSWAFTFKAENSPFWLTISIIQFYSL